MKTRYPSAYRDIISAMSTKPVLVRLNETGVERLDAIAGEHSLTRTALIRLALKFALNHGDFLPWVRSTLSQP